MPFDNVDKGIFFFYDSYYFLRKMETDKKKIDMRRHEEDESERERK